MTNNNDPWEQVNWWEQRFHPHRKVIIELLREINPESVLELGCGDGQNLYNIKKEFPDARVVGTDIDKERIDRGLLKMAEENIDVEMRVGDLLKEEFPEKSFDVVLTDATLLMIDMTEKELKEVMGKIINTAKKEIILVEWHSDNLDFIGKNIKTTIRVVRNYIELLNMFGIKDVQLKKITEKDWTSKIWQDWGYYIIAKIC